MLLEEPLRRDGSVSLGKKHRFLYWKTSFSVGGNIVFYIRKYYFLHKKNVVSACFIDFTKFLMIVISYLHRDKALGPLGSVKKQFRGTMREQEEVGPYLLELIVHVVLPLGIADTRYLPAAFGNVNPHVVELHDVNCPVARGIAADVFHTRLFLLPVLLLKLLRLLAHLLIELVIDIDT